MLCTIINILYWQDEYRRDPDDITINPGGWPEIVEMAEDSDEGDEYITVEEYLRVKDRMREAKANAPRSNIDQNGDGFISQVV